jgi:hypothetical protein
VVIAWRAGVSVEKPRLIREHHGLDAVTKVELLEDVRDVCLDGRVADVELAADLGVRETARDKAKYVYLALGEIVELPWRRGLPNARELFDHAFGDGGGEQSVSAGHDADGGEELFGRVVLEQETAGAGPERFVHVLVEVESRQDEDPQSKRVVIVQDIQRRSTAYRRR